MKALGERGPCRTCKVEVLWMKTRKGKIIPVNISPTAEVAAAHGLLFDHKTMISHFATCPEAFSWKKKKEPKAPKTSDTKDGEANWQGKCCVCGQSPTVGGTDLCGPCCFGEAETVAGNF